VKKRTRQKPPKPAEDSFKRSVTLRAEDIDEVGQRVAVSVSSQTDHIRPGGIPQILVHESGAVDISPLRDVGAVLMNHDPNQIVGRPENVRIDEKTRRVRADIVFDKDEASQAAFAKVQSGSLRGASVGFKVTSWKRLDQGDKWESPGGQRFEGPADVADKWKIFEFSLTPIAADSEVGVGRSTQGREPEKEFVMEEKLKAELVKRGLSAEASDEEAQDFILRTLDTPPEKPKPKPEDPEPEPLPTEDSVRLGQEKEKLERERCTQIAELSGAYPQYRAMCSTMIAEGHSVAVARGAILEQLSKDRPPARQVFSSVESGEDARRKFHRACVDSISLRATGSLRKDRGESESAFLQREREARDMAHPHIMETLRHSLRTDGLSDRGRTEEVIKRAISHSSSDFPAILKDASEKQLQRAYAEYPATWRPLAKIGNARNFLPMNRPKLGNMGNLIANPELVPMAEGSTVDVNESFSIGTYSRRFGISRQALINDDLSAFDRIPTGMGQAAARTVTDTVYALLISAAGVGPTMAEDSLALFATTHTSGANYIAAVGTPDVAGLSALKLLMRKQKGFVAANETAPILNITARMLLVPAALETAARQTVASLGDPSKSNDITFNPFRGELEVIVEPRLDAGTNGTTAWYLVADPSQVEGLEVAFLNGQDTPNLIEVQGTNVLGTEWGVYLDFGAKFIEHRGWARTRGA
jgi:phage head maturation protease